jgi:succinyl-diaminopimelate desuccinylase
MNTYLSDIIKNISQIIKFNSTQAPATEGKPFGEGAAKCLEFYLSLATFLGFEVKNYDNYVGEVDFGSGEDFAVLAHLDVVPAGSGWQHDPFGGEVDEQNKKIWGRGAMDDKGPAIIALYALKALKDEGFKPKKRIKLILGCNEETGWACIDHYNKVAKMPEVGISPDANFPVIYAEKGILHLKFAFKENCQNFSCLKGGNLPNMVCDYCEAQAPEDKQLAEKLHLSFEDEKVISRGKSAHGSTPEMGINALPAMLSYLGLEDIIKVAFKDKFGVGELEDETGKLTLSPNLIEQKENTIYLTCDIRYPATYTQEFVLSEIKKTGIPYEIVHAQAPLYNDKNSQLVQTLLAVYNEVTGKHEQPIAIGGGTYARALKYGAAFGPEEEGEENTIHQANEYITFDKIEKCFLIYKNALQRLTK